MKNTLQRPWIKVLFYIFIAVSAILAIERFCYRCTQGFCLNKILPDIGASFSLPPSSPIDPEKEAALSSIVNQPFYFLGKGAQFYAFCSADDQTVLKVFKHYHTMPNTQTLRQIKLPHFLDSFRLRLISSREREMENIFKSVQLTFANYREETGLIYIHLHPTHHFQKKLTLYDKIGIKHEIDLDQVPFVLQKKAELVYPQIDSLLKQKDIEGAKKAIDSLMQLIMERGRKGIANTDAFIRNFGFIGTQAIEIDIGFFTLNDQMTKIPTIKRELYYEIVPLRKWIRRYHPEFSKDFDEKIQTYLKDDF